MTTLEVTVELPDDLAQQAKQAGLLEAHVIARLLQNELRRNRIDQLFEAADQLAAIDLPVLDETEILQEIELARTQRRAPNASRP